MTQEYEDQLANALEQSLSNASEWVIDNIRISDVFHDGSFTIRGIVDSYELDSFNSAVEEVLTADGKFAVKRCGRTRDYTGMIDTSNEYLEVRLKK